MLAALPGRLADWWRAEFFLFSALDRDSAEFRARHIHTVNRLTPILAVANLAIATLVVGAFRNTVAGHWLLLWFALLASWCLQVVYSWWRKHRRAAQRVSPRAVLRTIQGALLLALLWAAAAIFWYPTGDPEQRLLLATVTVGMLGGGVLSLAMVPQAAWTYLTTLSSAVVLALLISPGELNPYLTVLFIVYAGVLGWFVLNTTRVFTARLMSEREAARQSQLVGLLLRDFEEHAADLLWEVTASGTFSHVTARLAEALECREEELQVTTLIQALQSRAPKTGGKASADDDPLGPLADSLALGRAFVGAVVPVVGSAGLRWWSISAKPLHDEAGRPAGWRGVISDVTHERDRAELLLTNEAITRHSVEVTRLNKALAVAKTESEQRLRSLIAAEEQLRAEAEQRNRDKSRFLANAVHDLKQPLQAISSALHPSLHANQRGDAAKSAELIQLAQSAAEAMRNQLGAIIDISRLESGLINADLGDFELLGLVEDVVRQQTHVARPNRVQLRVASGANDKVHVHSDRAFIERILLNLIGNGIKYRDRTRGENAEVCVSVETLPASVRVDVIDNGQGISAEHLASGIIFEPFFQANNHLGENEKGSGLGLSIVRSMVAILAGHHLSVRSEPGEGSVFSLELPRSSQLASIDVAAVPGDETLSALTEQYVLLIEDDRMVRQATAALFDCHGLRYEAYDTYESFAAAVESLERVPDVLLSDFRLPNGRTAVDVIRHARFLFPGIPAVVLSGEIGKLAGLDEFADVILLRKPLSPGDILNTLVAS